MAKVRLEIPPWVARMLNEQHVDSLILEREIEEGTTLGELLSDLALKYHNFDKMVYNPSLGHVADQLVVVLNDTALQDLNMTEVKLKDGDSVMLLPVFSGG